MGLTAEVRLFDPACVRSFLYLGWEFDESTAEAAFHYGFDTGERFTETFAFEGANLPLCDERRRALEGCLFHLYLVAGVSYYKAAVPSQIEIAGGPLDDASARFLEELFLGGLAEFAYKNGIELSGRVRFPSSPLAPILQASRLRLPRRTAVPVGGGKDSVVTIEALRAAGEQPLLFSLGRHRAIEEVASVASLRHVRVSRCICPRLLELNRRGALNGHVPISAIIAFTLASAGVLYGFDAAALSNERSANTGSELAGREINHQYSKGLDFESSADRYIRAYVLEGFRYFSFLRPLSEVGIARLFSRLTPYHDVFTSCNAAFRSDPSRRVGRWCLDCPKCRFVFLALAPFLPRTRLAEVFSADLLDDMHQIAGFDELTGLAGHKPFECVGEISESRAAFHLLFEREEWRGAVLVEHMRTRLPRGEGPTLVAEALSFSDRHRLPEAYLETLRAYLSH